MMAMKFFCFGTVTYICHICEWQTPTYMPGKSGLEEDISSSWSFSSSFPWPLTHCDHQEWNESCVVKCVDTWPTVFQRNALATNTTHSLRESTATATATDTILWYGIILQWTYHTLWYSVKTNISHSLRWSHIQYAQFGTTSPLHHTLKKFWHSECQLTTSFKDLLDQKTSFTERVSVLNTWHQ